MAHLFKVKTTKPLPKDAEIVSKDGEKFVRLKRNGRSTLHPLAPGGKRYTQESRKWYIQYKDSEGVWQRVPGFTDKDATAQRAAELERNAERQESGLADTFKKGKTLCTWLVRDGHTPSNPIAYLQALNARTDVRRQRRELSADEFSALVNAAASGPIIQGVAGPDLCLSRLDRLSTPRTGIAYAKLVQAQHDSAQGDGDRCVQQAAEAGRDSTPPGSGGPP